jgi:uncharacterized protein YjiS (DUF1127 family)
MSAFTIRTARSAAENVSHWGRNWLELAAQLAHEWEVRRASRALEALDDAMLRDVGVARGDIDYAARYGRNSRKA